MKNYINIIIISFLTLLGCSTNNTKNDLAKMNLLGNIIEEQQFEIKEGFSGRNIYYYNNKCDLTEQGKY